MTAPQTLAAGRFELGALIGAGATGSVYRGRDTLSGAEVAVKILHNSLLLSEPEQLERFRREGEILRRLDHPNIVKILFSAEESGRHFLVMEYIGGGSLADLLHRQTRLPVDRAIAISLELADALARAHHLKILHRDIKPANILLDEDGSPHLSDFGLARLSGAPGLTQTGMILGTPYYLSPEACFQQEIDERSDLWSFGVVLFEMLTGYRPFRGDGILDVIYAIKNQPTPDPASYREDLPPDLADLVRRMLRKDPPARISSARQVGAELEQIQPGRSRPPASQAPENGPEESKEAASLVKSALPGEPSASAPKIRVLIVDDHAVVRQGLRTFIDLQGDMEVVGEGSDGLEGVELAASLQPDVILMDLVMPNLDGVSATRQIRQRSPRSHIFILTSFVEDNQIFAAIRSGAEGYLLKDIQPNDLVAAVRAASQGQVQLHPQITRKLMAAIASSPPDRPAPDSSPSQDNPSKPSL